MYREPDTIEQYYEYVEKAKNSTTVEALIEKLQSNIEDMDSHTYYSHASEWPIDADRSVLFTVGDVYFLLNYLEEHSGEA